MASITIPNRDGDVKTRLRVRATDNGRSMEEETRLILRKVVEPKITCRNLANAIRARITPLGGVDSECRRVDRGTNRLSRWPWPTAGYQ